MLDLNDINFDISTDGEEQQANNVVVMADNVNDVSLVATKKKLQSCVNCGTGLMFKQDTEYYPVYGIVCCKKCTAVVCERKNTVYSLEIDSPEMAVLLKKAAVLKKYMYCVWLTESLLAFYRTNKDFNVNIFQLCPYIETNAALASIDLNKIQSRHELTVQTVYEIGLYVENILRDWRLRNSKFGKFSKDKKEKIGGALKTLCEAQFFDKFGLLKSECQHRDFVREDIQNDENFLQDIDRNIARDICITKLFRKRGQYGGTPGNSAKKSATRIWRLLRTLDHYNNIFKEIYPNSSKSLEFNYNEGFSVQEVLSKVNTKLDLTTVVTGTDRAVNIFKIRIIRKSTPLRIPASVYLKKKNNTKVLFLADYEQEEAGAPRQKIKDRRVFEYVAIMTLQPPDKIAQIKKNKSLSKMGDNIWLANVYTLSKLRGGV